MTVRRAGEPTRDPGRRGGSAPVAEGAAALQPAVAAARRPTSIRVESPMVGTFYRAPSPGAPPFVEVGDTVEPGQTLCILEAMKLMNEVKAEHEGVVRRVCVENEQAGRVRRAPVRARAARTARPLDAL